MVCWYIMCCYNRTKESNSSIDAYWCCYNRTKESNSSIDACVFYLIKEFKNEIVNYHYMPESWLKRSIDAEVEIYSAQEQAISTAIMLLEQWNIFETEWYFMIFVSKLAYKIGLKTAEDCSSSTTLLSSAQLGKSKALGLQAIFLHQLLDAETTHISQKHSF